MVDPSPLQAWGVHLVHEAVLCASMVTDADAEGLIAVWQRFRAHHGDRIRWQSDGSGRWKKASRSMWDRFEAQVHKRRAILSWDLHAGETCDGVGPAAPALSLLASDGELTLRWVEGDAPAPWSELAAHLGTRWGYAGRGLFGPAYSEATQGRHDPIGDALQADPFLGPTHPTTWGAIELGVCHIGPVLILGEALVAALGGADAVRDRAASLGVGVDACGHALCLTLGEPPSAEAARGLWAWLAPVRPDDTLLDEMTWVPGLTMDEMSAWAARWA